MYNEIDREFQYFLFCEERKITKEMIERIENCSLMLHDLEAQGEEIPRLTDRNWMYVTEKLMRIRKTVNV